jgi:hypothetical protein
VHVIAVIYFFNHPASCFYCTADPGKTSDLSWGMLGAFTHLVNCPDICCYCTAGTDRKIEFNLYTCPVKKSSEEVVNTGKYSEGTGTLSNTENELLTVMCYWECTGSLAVPRNLVHFFDNQSC